MSDLKKNDAFVTVINVSSASSADAPSVPPPLPPPTTATNSNYKSSDDYSSGNQNSGTVSGQKKIALSNSEKSASLPLASSKRANKKLAILPTGT